MYNTFMNEKITSLSNKEIIEYTKLQQKKYRDKLNLFIIEGHHIIEEAKKKNLIKKIFTIDPNIEGTLVTNEILAKLTNTKTPQSVVAICDKIKTREPKGRTLVLDNVQDPGNVGTLIRTAKAFGWDTVIVSGVDIYNPKIIRSTQGAIFDINVIWTDDVSKYLKDKKVYGAMLDKNAKKYNEIKFDKNDVLLLGNEGNGISGENKKYINTTIYIPIDFESLNVASAGAILLNEYKK